MSTAQASLVGDLPPQLEPFAETLAYAVARSVPTVNASAAFSYRFDPRTNSFERDASVSGQLYLETASVVGAGEWNVAVSYQYFSASSIDGQDVDDLHARGEDPVAPGLTLTYIQNLALRLAVQTVTTSVTYGVTDALQINLTVPVMYTAFELDGDVKVKVGAAPLQTTTASGGLEQATGIGDLLVRAKYQAFDGDGWTAAVGLGLRLPTGNEDDLQGTGAVGVLPGTYASTDWRPLGHGLLLRDHANVAMDFDADSFDRSEVTWGVGGDLGIGERGTVGLAVLGGHAINTLTSTASPSGCLPPQCEAEVGLLGVDVDRSDTFDASVGGRFVLVPERVIFFANVLIPLNDDGVRAAVVPLVGFEGLF